MVLIFALAFLLPLLPAPTWASNRGIVVQVSFTTEIPRNANAFQIGQLFMDKAEDATDQVVVPDPGQGSTSSGPTCRDRIVVPDPGQGYDIRHSFLKTVNKTILVHRPFETVTTTCGMETRSEAVPTPLVEEATIFPVDSDHYHIKIVVDRLDGQITVKKNGCTVTEPNIRRRIVTLTVSAPGKKIDLRLPVNGKTVAIKTIRIGTDP